MATTFAVVEAAESFTHVAIIGALDLASTREIELRFTASTAGRHKSVIIDMSQVPFIASVGIGLLIQVSRTLATDRQSLVLLAPSEMIEHTIRIARLDTVIRMVKTIEEARELLKLAPHVA